MKIKNPCAENYMAMKKNKEGRFCDLCSKTVVDFTKMNASEIQNYLALSNGEVCGRFKTLQLNQKNGLEKIIYNFRECVSGLNIKPIRVAVLTLISGITAFMSSCMGVVDRSYLETNNKDEISKDTLSTKQTPSKPH